MSATKTRLDVLIDRQAAFYDGRTEGGRIAKDARAELASLRATVTALEQAVNEARLAIIDALNHGDVSADYPCKCPAHLWLAAYPADAERKT